VILQKERKPLFTFYTVWVQITRELEILKNAETLLRLYNDLIKDQTYKKHFLLRIFHIIALKFSMMILFTTTHIF